jgi:sulfur-carrier protein
MNYKIRTFGVARDILGGKEVMIALPGDTVADLRKYLSGNYPKLDDLRSLFIAVNQKYADDHAKLNETDEIALIPPVSGG